MWMGRSVEGGRESSSINPHPYGSSSSGSSGYQQSQFRSYNGSNQDTNNADWKSRIVENGQWLGGKVLEYGVKLARRSSHNDIPDHRPVNDGRANWMADIRNGSYNHNASSQQSYSNCSSGYQNDFAYGRPSTYSDQCGSNQNNAYNSSGHTYSNNNYKPKIDVTEAASRLAQRNNSTSSRKGSRRKPDKSSKGKSKKERKSRSKSRKDKHSRTRSPQISSSESEEESETSSVYSESEEEVQPSKSQANIARRCARSGSSSKDSSSESSEASSSEEDRTTSKTAKKLQSQSAEKSSPSTYKYSFDPSNLPRPPTPKKSQKTTQLKKAKESRSRKSHTKEKTRRKQEQEQEQEPAVVVDLLDVEFAPAPVPKKTPAPTPDVFDIAPIDQLAGLDFGTCPPTMSSVQMESKVAPVSSSQVAPQVNGGPVASNGSGLTVPGSELFNLDSLMQTQVVKAPSSTKTLNELQQQQCRPVYPQTGFPLGN